MKLSYLMRNLQSLYAKHGDMDIEFLYQPNRKLHKLTFENDDFIVLKDKINIIAKRKLLHRK